jgi:hypothetical protein
MSLKRDSLNAQRDAIIIMSDHQAAIEEELRRQEQMLLASGKIKKVPLIHKDHKYFDSIEMCRQNGQNDDKKEDLCHKTASDE